MLVVAAGAVFAAAALAPGRTSEATGPAVIRLTGQQISDRLVPNKQAPGTLEIVRLRLFGSTSPSRPIGHGTVMCTYVAGKERSCLGEYVLPRGMIVTGGVLETRLLYSAAITGGTGLYNNARGTLTVTVTGFHPRRELLLFRLSG